MSFSQPSPVSPTRPPGSPMQFLPLRTAQIMLVVMLATTPAILIGTWFFGYGILLNIGYAMGISVLCESIVAKLSGKQPRELLADNSGLVTALLFALTVPPGTPWWLITLGLVFAIGLVKHAYGGLGQNPFNPAMAGYLFLLLAFPLDMTTWHLPGAATDFASPNSPLGWQGLTESFGFLFPFLSYASDSTVIDGFAKATPLIESKLAAVNAVALAASEGLFIFSRSAETGWELMNYAYLFGGVLLLFSRIISWHIPASVIAGTLIMSLLFYSPSAAAVVGTPYLHLFGSATMLGAFFIATDPVSAASGNRARIAYGIVIGVSIYSVRVWGSYLDAVAIAVLFGNFCAPLLDRMFAPRRFGRAEATGFLLKRKANGESR